MKRTTEKIVIHETETSLSPLTKALLTTKQVIKAISEFRTPEDLFRTKFVENYSKNSVNMASVANAIKTSVSLFTGDVETNYTGAVVIVTYDYLHLLSVKNGEIHGDEDAAHFKFVYRRTSDYYYDFPNVAYKLTGFDIISRSYYYKGVRCANRREWEALKTDGQTQNKLSFHGLFTVSEEFSAFGDYQGKLLWVRLGNEIHAHKSRSRGELAGIFRKLKIGGKQTLDSLIESRQLVTYDNERDLEEFFLRNAYFYGKK